MKRHIYNKVISVAMLASGLAFTACQDDDFVQYTAFEVGDEIRFCASAAQDGSATTRTVYGATGTIDGVDYIALNWEKGDKMEIVSPQAALSGGTGKAVYAIADSIISEGFKNETEGHSNASMLKKEGESGLQWGVGYTKDVNGDGAIDELEEGLHDFYALYPSSNSFASDAEGHIALDLLQVNDTVRPTATGYMPIVQKPNVKKGDGDGISIDVSDGKTTYTIHPDMRYAYMVATTQTSRYKKVDEEEPPIQLEFKPVTTALQFEITANEISSTNGSELTITSIQLATAPNVTKNICGYFTCDYLSGQMYAQNEDETYNRIYLDLSGATESITLKKDDKCDVTFFVLPTDSFKAGDLQLQIFFTLKGSPQVRTATINKPLAKMKKYHFKNLLMPPFTTKVTGSSWWQALDPKTLVSQVSIPVASNVFALEKFKTGEDSNGEPIYQKTGFSATSCQQVMSFTDLWDMGVRGFEIQTQKHRTGSGISASSTGAMSLANAYFTCDENCFESDTYNFDYAFKTLVNKLRPIVDDSVSVSKECLILVCTYQASNDGYNPHNYVSQLINYLNAYLASAHATTRKLTKSNFIQITSGTTAGELQGNIAIVIRPGDDDRYETDNTTATIELGAWAGNLTLIQDWGTAFDVWDRRYRGVAREATFETQYVIGMAKKSTSARPQIEDWLCGVSTENTPYTQMAGAENFNEGVEWPEKLDTFDYKHDMKGNTAGKAYVQEWARVAKENIGPLYTNARTGVTVGWLVNRFEPHGHLWAKWPESLTDKKKAIDGLFELSVAEKGKVSSNLYINSLSGYYIDAAIENGDGYKVSLLPFKVAFKASNNTETNANGQGKGGDHVSLAYDLNKYVYGILSGGDMKSGGTLAEGPWGLVMMEHIGNTTNANDKSVDLVNLIMMNNFKFPLMTGGNNGGNGDTPPPATRDVAVSFSNEPANPSGAIY